MRTFIVLPLLVLLAACTERGPIGPDGPDGPLFKKCSSPPCDKGGGGGGDAEGDYTITDLGTLPGNTLSGASGINVNSAGGIQVVGSSWGPDDGFDVPTLWTVGSDDVPGVDALAMPEDWKYAAALAITEKGIAVGASGVGPVYWAADRSAKLLPVGAGASGGRANDVVSLVDGDVFIVGQQRTSLTQAVYWVGSPFELATLPALKPSANASAEAVNSAGTIAGWSSPGHPVVWHLDTDGSYQVCDLGGGADNSGVAFGISEPTGQPTGQLVYVVGASDAQDYFATVWTVNLGTTNWASGLCEVTTTRRLDFFSEFRDVNAQGNAVGEDFRKHRAILWPESNPLVYLPLLTNKGLGFSGADAISADGTHIAGRSRIKKGMRAVIWTRKD